MQRLQQTPVRIKLRLEFGDGFVLGPGKAELLRLISDLGSISAAGRAMGMSYKRAWSLVEEMNHAFRQPVVTSSRGGSGGGGAILTDTGRDVLCRYSGLCEAISSDGQPEIARLSDLLK